MLVLLCGAFAGSRRVDEEDEEDGDGQIDNDTMPFIAPSAAGLRSYWLPLGRHDGQQEKKTTYVAPIQITIAKRHTNSETVFYLDWDKWDEELAGYEIKSDFFWISTKKRKGRTVQEEERQLSDRTIRVPKHTIYWVAIEQVHANLAHKLKRVAGMNDDSDVPGKNTRQKRKAEAEPESDTSSMVHDDNTIESDHEDSVAIAAVSGSHRNNLKIRRVNARTNVKSVVVPKLQKPRRTGSHKRVGTNHFVRKNRQISFGN
ncbi:hypothetical protein F5887DRAFT_1068740 [Amanita rubescens]|nr:hypothetical protein F5887DRAFT_1068740 [Amanita rubescens]